MKQINRILSLMMALMLLVSLAVPVMAEGNDEPGTVTIPTEGEHSITINNAANGHTYEAYMIFYGEHHVITSESDPILTDLVWGSGVSAYDGAAVEAGTPAGSVAGTLNDSNVVAFSKKLTLSDPVKRVEAANGVCVFEEMPSGYYLVKDKDDSIKNTAHDAYTNYIIQVVGNAQASLKVNVPTLEKSVQDINDSTQNPAKPETHKPNADHDIGDDVPFHIHINIGSNVEDYPSYEMVVTDIMSKGLTFNEESVEISTDLKTFVKDKDYTINVSGANENGDVTITFAFPNLITSGITNLDTIEINYTAELNDNAVIGNPGNPNKAYMTYSNNPNKADSYGTTPESKVVIFTYQLTLNKVDGNDEPLNGATFKLSKYLHGNEWDPIETIEGTDKSVFEFKGLDDGTYRIEEVEAPAGYNAIKPITFTIEANHDSGTVENLTATAQGGSGTLFGQNSGTFEADVVNEMGATLPTTGGMGTTILYVVGAALVLVAVVMLVTKKRVADAE